MAEHARFERLVAEAKRNIQEISPQDTAAALKRGAQQLVDASAAWLLILLALLALGLPRLLPDLVLPPPTLAHRLALGVLLLLFAASLLRRGGRAWIGDLWPHRSHGHSH